MKIIIVLQLCQNNSTPRILGNSILKPRNLAKNGAGTEFVVEVGMEDEGRGRDREEENAVEEEG